jgi:hypothetical protein
MGYINYSMSEGAYWAYKEGKVPFSKLNNLTKRFIRVLTNGYIENLATEWHHTSKFYNETQFFDKRIEIIVKENKDKVYELLNLNDELLRLSLKFHWDLLNVDITIRKEYPITDYFRKKIGGKDERFIYLMINYIGWFENVYYSNGKPTLNWKYMDTDRRKIYRWWGGEFESMYKDKIKVFENICKYFEEKIDELF